MRTLLIALSLLIAIPAFAMDVAVSILPQKYFVEKIGGSRVRVSVMLPPGASEATYEPKPKQMTAVAKAQIYFAIGVPFERSWLKRITSQNSSLTIVQTDANLPKEPIAEHSHGEDDHHGEEGLLDPHVWLSPRLVKMQAETIKNALQKADPAHAQEFERNYQAFVKNADDLDKDLKKALAPFRGRAFLVYHPTWGYFAREYGLTQLVVEDGGREPRPAKLAELIKEAKKANVKMVLVQPQFSSKSALVIAQAIGARLVEADPMSPAWEQMMRTTALSFITNLR